MECLEEEGPKQQNVFIPRFNVLCSRGPSRQRHDYAPHEHPRESFSCS